MTFIPSCSVECHIPCSTYRCLSGRYPCYDSLFFGVVEEEDMQMLCVSNVVGVRPRIVRRQVSSCADAAHGPAYNAYDFRVPLLCFVPNSESQRSTIFCKETHEEVKDRDLVQTRWTDTTTCDSDTVLQQVIAVQ